MQATGIKTWHVSICVFLFQSVSEIAVMACKSFVSGTVGCI